MKKTFAKIIASTLIMWVMFSASVNFVVFGEAEGWQVDVYTQKTPYSGIGLNQSSDAFGPNDVVVLYANVVYNMYPIQNVPVAFQVSGPLNPVENVSFILSATSDSEGIAEANFTIPSPEISPEIAVFGLWNVTAHIENASDFLSFKVGWIVELTSLRAVDDDPPQGGWLQVELSLMNIAMVPKNTTLSLVLFDSLNNIVGGLLMENFVVNVGPSNFSTAVQVYYLAEIGVGSVKASVYSHTGAPYSPSLSADFRISFIGDLNLDYEVNMMDVSIAGRAFGAFEGHPRWNPKADITGEEHLVPDGIVDMRDISLIARNFGKTRS